MTWRTDRSRPGKDCHVRVPGLYQNGGVDAGSTPTWPRSAIVADVLAIMSFTAEPGVYGVVSEPGLAILQSLPRRSIRSASGFTGVIFSMRRSQRWWTGAFDNYLSRCRRAAADSGTRYCDGRRVCRSGLDDPVGFVQSANRSGDQVCGYEITVFTSTPPEQIPRSRSIGEP
ncbi:MAG: hypothetical protein ACLT76_01470 [Clostridium fessum]